MTAPRYLPLGDAGLVVEFGGDEISDAASVGVRALRSAVEAARPAGLVETVPTYRSLLIVFDVQRTSPAAIRAAVEDAVRQADPSCVPPGRLIEIPVAYGSPHGPDLSAVAAETGLSETDVVSLHAASEYVVYMLGFTPGFPYMGALPPALRVARLASPRTRVPERSVAIAGQQTGLYPVESPGGWRLIGRTPLRVYDPARREPFLIDAGDRVRFTPISREEYARLAPQELSAAPPPVPRAPQLVAERAGLYTTIQDLGRPGYRRFGLPRSGAMDPLALAITNLLLGNAVTAAALEFTSPGPRLVAPRRVTVALGGADLSPTLNGRPVPVWTALPLREGDVLAMGAPRAGRWGYLAAPGGFDVPPVLGSRATYARGALGGFGGRRLEDGDRLAGVRPTPAAALRLAQPAWPSPGAAGPSPLRVVLGPQDDYFTPEAVATLLGSAYTPALAADRVGYRLDGPTLAHRGRTELLSDGLLPGAVQVPAGGQPIVIMADGPTTGGYPKIAAIVRPDLRRLAQARRGEEVRFRAVPWEEAHAAAREETAALAGLRFEPAG